MRAIFPSEFGFGVGMHQKKYVAIVAARCLVPFSHDFCPAYTPTDNALNQPAGHAKITVDKATKRRLKLPSPTLAEAPLKAGGMAASAAFLVSSPAMKKRLKALHKSWSARSFAKGRRIYVRATVTLSLTYPVTETITRSGRYLLDYPLGGDEVGSKYAKPMLDTRSPGP